MPLVKSKKVPTFGRICAVIGLCCLVNAAVWSYYTVKHGGHAPGGVVENGRYFFVEHGVKTEVTPEVWRFSKAYTKVTIVLFAVGALALFIFGVYANDAREQPSQLGETSNGNQP